MTQTGEGTRLPLLDFLQSNPETVRSMAIDQIVHMAGDGRLRDGSTAQSELRAFLGRVQLPDLERYANHCLSSPFDKSGFVLQDIVNELGRRLEYGVVDGRYQGVSNAVGFDGLWQDPAGHRLVVEVKTTDTYRLSLDKYAGYMEQLRADGEIFDPCSILIVVGRTDTGELEAQVRGSRHAWGIRLIGVDALVRLVHIKENAESEETGRIVRQLLTPLDFFRLDQLVDAVFTTAHDLEDSAVADLEDDVADAADESSTVRSAPVTTSPEILAQLREQAITALGRDLRVAFVKKSRSLYWDADGRVRVACAVSKPYLNRGAMRYWYAYHQHHHKFLSEAGDAYLLWACVGLEFAFAVPLSVLSPHLGDLNTTEPEGRPPYYHIKIFEPSEGLYELRLPRAGESVSLNPYMVALSDSSSLARTHPYSSGSRGNAPAQR